MDNKSSLDSHPLTIATWNADGIANKKIELELFLVEYQVDILMVSETMLKENDSFHIKGFRSVKRPRVGRPGGGVAVFARSCFCFQKLDLDTTVEAIGINTWIEGTAWNFIAVYNPPSSVLSIEDFSKLTANSHTVIGGDINAKDPSWGSRSSNYAGIHLRRLLARSAKSHIYGPEDATHIPTNANHRGDVLDIFISHDAPPIRKTRTVHRLSSDHFPVVAECGQKTKQDTISKRTNWISFAWQMGQFSSPDTPLAQEDIDREAERLTTAIQEAVRNNTTESTSCRGNRLGLNTLERALVQEKNRVKTRWSRFRNPHDRILLNRLQAQVKLMLKERKAEEWRQVIEGANDEDQRFWSLLRTTKRRSDPNAPLRVNGQLLLDDLGKAEAAADHFELQFTNTLPEDPRIVKEIKESVRKHRNSIDKDYTPIGIETIASKIKTLQWRKAPGFDDISNKAIRLLPKHVLQVLVRLINGILQHGIFPNIWKKAVLISIPKKSKDPTKLNNRRPISLLPGLAKLCESVVKDQIQAFAESHGIIKANQFGFRNRLAAVYQAAHLAAIVEANNRPRRKVIAVFLDVAKAYDRVWKDGLIHKLVKLQFPNTICKLILSWITQRTFVVRVGSHLSSVRTAVEGLPQGSALSPLLFNIFVHDLPHFQENPLIWSLQFADDTAVVAVGRDFDSARNRAIIGLNKIANFCSQWKIELNQDKTEAILFGRSRPQDYHINFQGQIIKLKNSATYLGVIFDRNLNFQKHTESRKKFAIYRLRQLRGLLNQKSDLDISNRLRIARAIAIPTATYGEEVWVTGSLKASNTATTAQNIIYRRCLGAYRYITNEDIREEVKAEDLRERAWERRRNMIERLRDHPSADVAAIGQFIEDTGPLG